MQLKNTKFKIEKKKKKHRNATQDQAIRNKKKNFKTIFQNIFTGANQFIQCKGKLKTWTNQI